MQSPVTRCESERLLERDLRMLFAMGEEHRLGDRQALLHPGDEFRRIGMAGIILHPADRGLHVDLLAMNFHHFFAVEQQPPERAFGLESDQQHRRCGFHRWFFR